MNKLPLLSGCEPQDVFAWQDGQAHSVRRFVAQAQALAQILPPVPAVLNVCRNRYHFALGFAAGVLSGKVSLQPASQAAATLAQVADEFPRLICLRDDDFCADGMDCLDFPDLAAVDGQGFVHMPQIPADQLAAILFTSGSTGQPQPQRKHWGKLLANGRAGAHFLRHWLPSPPTLVATVPVQHSYGFESSLLLALVGAASFHAGKPFYPQDIVQTLASVPAPRVLVTTPLHLDTLLASGLALPALAAIVSATAPLDEALAQRVRTQTATPLLEIYGSTESGQIAGREPLADARWRLFEGLELRSAAAADDASWQVSGAHVEGQVTLGDRIRLHEDGRHFALLGRHQDRINIAGKRSSLEWLNHQLRAIEGVVDGAFYMPQAAATEAVTRLVAFVVAPALDDASLRAALRERIEPTFMPRPLYRVDKLPRNSTGKLPRTDLAALHQSLVQSKTQPKETKTDTGQQPKTAD